MCAVCALSSHLCFSKLSCALRLKASAATVLSRCGAVRPQVQWEQHQPVKSSPSPRSNVCSYIYLLRAFGIQARAQGNVVKNLFVGNLGPEVTHEELRRLFEAFGQVVQVHIIVDRDTGLPRGFAFVEMTNDAEAEKAIKALNGSILRDRTLDVNYARPRPERPAA